MNSYDTYMASRRGGTWHKVGFVRAQSSAAALKKAKVGKQPGEVFKVKLVARGNPAVKVKAIRVKNFTGTISNVKGRTVVKGRSKGR
jgi:hypothetical protein